jgi:DNA-binding XRE family transcriptional regulator
VKTKGSLTRLKEMRQLANMTQQQAADKLKIPIGTYRNWEQLKNNPSFPMAESLASLFACALRDFYSVKLLPDQELEATDKAFFDIKVLYAKLNRAGRERLLEYTREIFQIAAYNTDGCCGDPDVALFGLGEAHEHRQSVSVEKKNPWQKGLGDAPREIRRG